MKKLLLFLVPLIIIAVTSSVVRVESTASYKDLIGVKYTLKKNSTLLAVMRKANLTQTVRDSIISYLSQKVDLSQCMPGEEFFIYTDSDMNFRFMEYHKNIIDVYIIEAKNGIYSVYRKPSEKHINTAYISGTIKTNLYETMVSLGESPELAQTFSSIFSWQIDCNADARKHNTFELLVEKIYINDNFYGYGKILYASLETDKRLYEGFYYNRDGEEAYFDMDGNSLSHGLLKAPMAFYSRISSGFTESRYHPVLKKYLPHKAIDYAAPSGTPIFAAGDGIIKSKFYDRYGGRVIIIEHENGYETEYMHLKSYSQKTEVGRYVEKGDIIGYVGKSGVATGSHLHYAVKCNGVYINPRRMEFESAIVLQDSELKTFSDYRNIVYNLLFATKSFISFPSYCSKKRYLFEYASINSQSTGL